MLLYYGITFWVFILLLLGLRPDSKITADCWPENPVNSVALSNKRIVDGLSLFTLAFFWFLTAFRSSEIGNDTKTYLYYFDIYSKGLDLTRTFEVGYQYLNYLIGKITKDHHLFLIVISTILYGGVGWQIKKYSKNIALSVCLFYCFFFSVFTSMLRQGIAMVIVLFGYKLLKIGKKIPAILFLFLATTFHTTAILSFLLLLNVEVLKKKWFVFGAATICGLFSVAGIFNKIVMKILPKYAHYFNSRYASTGWLAVSYSLIIYAIWYLLISKSVDENDKRDRIVATNFTFLLIFAAFGFSVNLFTRAGEYFLLIAIVEIPNMLYRGKIKNFRLWLFGLCTFLMIMFIVTLIYRPGWNHLYPYEFWH